MSDLETKPDMSEQIQNRADRASEKAITIFGGTIDIAATAAARKFELIRGTTFRRVRTVVESTDPEEYNQFSEALTDVIGTTARRSYLKGFKDGVLVRTDLPVVDTEAIIDEVANTEIGLTTPEYAVRFAAQTAVRLTLEQLGIVEPEHE